MRVILFLFLSLVFTGAISISSMAFAEQAKSGWHGEFYRLEKSWARSVSSSSSLGLGVYSLGFPNSTCTGTLISKEGHILLASHCLEPAIGLSNQVSESHGGKKFDFLQTKTVAQGFYLYEFNSHAILNHVEVPVGLDESVQYARIIALGKGYTSPRFIDQASPELRTEHIRLTNEGHSAGGDFAIVQLDSLRQQRCFKFSKEKPKSGDQLRSVSFGCYKGHGSWPEVRMSRVVSHSIEGAEVEVSIESSDQPTEKIYLPKGSFLTDTQAVECNSGTAVLNHQNQIVGVLHTVYEISDKLSYSMNLSIDRILELIPEDTRSFLVNLNSNCELN